MTAVSLLLDQMEFHYMENKRHGKNWKNNWKKCEFLVNELTENFARLQNWSHATMKPLTASQNK